MLVLAGMPDGEAVLNHVLACLDVGNGYLMPCGDVFQYGDLLAVHFYNGTCRQGLYGYNHIVGRIDFQDISHNLFDYLTIYYFTI